MDEQSEIEKLREVNKELIQVLKGIIDGCVHPNVAVRAVMVDLKPIRKILEKVNNL
jgi:hypothetical protein